MGKSERSAIASSCAPPRPRRVPNTYVATSVPTSSETAGVPRNAIVVTSLDDQGGTSLPVNVAVTTVEPSISAIGRRTVPSVMSTDGAFVTAEADGGTLSAAPRESSAGDSRRRKSGPATTNAGTPATMP